MSSEDNCSVRVALRIRPQLPREVIEMCRVCTAVTPGEPQVTLGSDRAFTYDYVFDTHVGQEEIYETCSSHLIHGALEGYNATILAYGQTGSGKSYTMGTGFDVDVNSEETGIIPRAINKLYDGIGKVIDEAKERGDHPPQFKITAQFLELYNEDIIDLFDVAREFTKGKKGIRIHETADRTIYLSGVRTEKMNGPKDALEWLRRGALARTTASTNMNEQSSRSHAIFTLHITQQRLVSAPQEDGEEGELETLTAKFHFVDLAGSERLKRTLATGDRAREGISINCGLLALGNVISALGDPSKKALHVPYRDSKLTRLLQDSLGGNSRTLMIACVSPSDRDFTETLNTLVYANRARNIQNKVVINQDKSSRTISMLKKEIQQLQMELLEYKQGKRVVTEDGEETVNDMYHENTLLQAELDTLRTRVKAMQETIDSLTVKNTELLAERAMSEWAAQDGDNKNGDVSQMVANYFNEIETLRAKLVESESTCAQLMKTIAKQKKTRSPSSGLDEDRDVDVVIDLAKRDLMKDVSLLNTKRTDDSDSEGESGGSDVDEDEEDKHKEYSEELAELTSQISIKQQLIDALEKSKQKMENMRQHYEDKLNQLQARIKATQDERDTVLASYSNSGSKEPSEKVKKIKEDYERRISDMQRQMKSLQMAKKEHTKTLRDLSHQESRIRTLNNEVVEMKRTKVKLMNKLRDEAAKHRESEARRQREIAQLKKQRRIDANAIKNLEAETRAKAIVLKRKQEEVSALRKAVNNRPGNPKRKGDTKKNSQQKMKKWVAIEKNISESTINKRTMATLEQELERKMDRRLELQNELKTKQLMLKDPKYKGSSTLEEEIDVLRADIDNVQGFIEEIQREMLQVEENKVCLEPSELSNFVADHSDALYILEKLYNTALDFSCQLAQMEASHKYLEQENAHMKKENATQQQLLLHVIEKQKNVSDSSLNGNSSSEASRSPSPLPPDYEGNHFKRETDKSRKKTMAPQDLLFSSSKPTTPTGGQSQSAASSPERNPLPSLLTRSFTTVKAAQSVPASPVTLRKGLTLSPRINRKTYIISTHPSMEKELNNIPRPSSPVYMRNNSREENVFSRLTSQSITTWRRNPGKITTASNKRTHKNLLICSHLVEGHSKAVLALHATENNLFTASKDRTVVMWDLREMRECQLFDNHKNSVVAVKYDPHNQVLICAYESVIKVWDVRSGECIKSVSGNSSNSLASTMIGADYHHINALEQNQSCTALYVAAGDRVRVWDLRKLAYNGKLSGHQAAVMCLSVSSKSNSEDIVVTGSKDHYIKVYDCNFETGGSPPPRVTLEPPHYDGIQSLALQGDTLYSGSRDCIIKKWTLDTHELVMSVNGAHKDWITGLCFSPSGSYLVSGCRGGVVKLWSDSCHQLSEIRAHESPINAITSNSTHVFTAANNGDVRMWKENTQELMSMSTGHEFQLSV